jgi:3-hydroxyisobutyrate dehydrogenase
LKSLEMKSKIAFIGTGLLGYPMAERLLKNGYNLIVYNRTTEKAVPLKKLGANIAKSSYEAIINSDLVITVLTTYEANVETLLNEEINYAGKTVIQMGTIGTNENVALMEKITKLGGDYIEAPVLGSIPQIKSGTLITLVGCDESLYPKWLPLLKTFGETVVHFGEVGKASAAKLAYNQLIATLTAAFSMSLGYVLAGGVDVEKFMEILRESALYSPTFDKKLPKMLSGDFTNPNFPLKHLLKDVEIIQRDFAGKNIDTKILEAITEILKRGTTRGDANLDYSAIFNSIVNRN